MECKADERNSGTGTGKMEHLGKGGSVTPLFQVCVVCWAFPYLRFPHAYLSRSSANLSAPASCLPLYVDVAP